MKTRVLAGLLLALLASPAIAQWQVPDHAIPVGRGAGVTGFASAAPGASAFPLVSNGISANPSFQSLGASAVTFTQSGTGAAAVTFDQLYRTVIVTPEMFGDGVPCSTASAAGVQKAITYLGTVVGTGRVQLANCMYAVSGPINIPYPTISLEGYVAGNTNGLSSGITFSPSAIGQCAINIANGASLVSNVSIKNLRVHTADSTTYKIGICISDGSDIELQKVYITNFFGGNSTAVTGAAANGSGEIQLTVANASVNYNDDQAVAVAGIVGTVEANNGWPIKVVAGNKIDLKGSVFTNAYVSGGTIKQSSTGLQTKGREYIKPKNVSISADLPLRISPNPNVAGGSESLDQSDLTNLTLGSATTTNCNAMVDTGVVLSSVKFLGTQSWGGGKDGFCWRDNSAAAISTLLRFDSVKSEQKTVAGGTLFNIRPNQTLYSLEINGAELLGNGILARNTANLHINNNNWLAGSGVCLNIDSTVQNTEITSSHWLNGGTTTLSGQTRLMATGPNPSSGCLPSFATYANSSATVNHFYTSIFDNATALSVMGRTANSNGASSDIQATAASDAVLRESGSTIGFGTIATGGIANNAVTLAKLATQATNTVLGNATSGSAVPTALSVGSCSTASSALIWTTNTGFGCNTSITAAAVPVGGITGLGTGVATALAVNIGTAGSFVANGGALGSPSSAGTLPAHTLGGTIAGGGNQINNVIIGTTTPLAGNFTTLGATGAITGGSSITVGTNSVNGNTISNGPNSGTGGGSYFVSQSAGVNNIGMGAFSSLISGGAFDATPSIYGASAIGVFISGTTRAMTIGIGTTAIPGITNVATTSAVCVNTTTGLLTYDGTIGTCTVSDERQKNMGERIPSALEKLLQINGVYYTWKDPAADQSRQIGVGAQTVEKVFPELVQTDLHGTKSVDYQRLTAPIIEAMRELKVDNDNLRACQESWKCRIFGR